MGNNEKFWISNENESYLKWLLFFSTFLRDSNNDLIEGYGNDGDKDRQGEHSLGGRVRISKVDDSVIYLLLPKGLHQLHFWIFPKSTTSWKWKRGHIWKLPLVLTLIFFSTFLKANVLCKNNSLWFSFSTEGRKPLSPAEMILVCSSPIPEEDEYFVEARPHTEDEELVCPALGDGLPDLMWFHLFPEWDCMLPHRYFFI